MTKYAAELSNGMKQRVGLARAFALSPKLLLLDEPFGMLDSLTRWALQEVLMEVWTRTSVTAVCVTHDVDEAILLADRVVMMTNGPNARVGRIVDIDIPRPRTRQALLAHPRYYEYREAIFGFLDEFEHGVGQQGCGRQVDGCGRMSEPLVIVGNGMAATRLVDELTRRAPGRYAITVVGEEPSIAYNRVLLSSLLAREIEDATSS